MRRPLPPMSPAKGGRFRPAKPPEPAAAPAEPPAPPPVRTFPYLGEGPRTMTLTVPNFLQLVHGWANENVERIRHVWPLAGGWEAWAQAEIAGYINARHPQTYIVREPMVYLDDSRADFLVNDPAQNVMADEIVVEMKCESLGNWRAFIGGLRFDTWKLNGQMRMGLDSGKKISLGIFFSPETQEQLAELTGYEIVYTHDQSIGLAAVHWSA